MVNKLRCRCRACGEHYEINRDKPHWSDSEYLCGYCLDLCENLDDVKELEMEYE